MNRAARRRRDRSTRHDLRANGCTCRPTIRPLTQKMWPPEATGGADISHQPGCPLGDWVATFNAVGVTPGLKVTPNGCGR